MKAGKCSVVYIVMGFMLLFLHTTLTHTAAAQEFSKKELERMGIFLSNFTELGMMNFTASDVLDDVDTLVNFGVWHNYINNYSSRIKPCADTACPHGALTLEAKYVLQTLKKYFAFDIKQAPAIEDYASKKTYFLQDNIYHFDGADGEQVIYARVNKAEKRTTDNAIIMTGELYNADDEEDIRGTFRALALPHTWGGKKTWSIVKLESMLN